MPNEIALTVNGTRVIVPSGATVAVAVALTGHACRQSVSGEPRGSFCGMGTCFECRVAINGQPHCRSCQAICEDGMDVRTNE